MSRYEECCKELNEINRKIAILIKRKKELTTLKEVYFYEDLNTKNFNDFYEDYLLVRINKGSDIFGSFC